MGSGVRAKPQCPGGKEQRSVNRGGTGTRIREGWHKGTLRPRLADASFDECNSRICLQCPVEVLSDVWGAPQMKKSSQAHGPCSLVTSGYLSASRVELTVFIQAVLSIDGT